MDWGLLSVPQAAAGNRKIHYSQGKKTLRQVYLDQYNGIHTFEPRKDPTNAGRIMLGMIATSLTTWKSPSPAHVSSLPRIWNSERNATNTTIKFDPDMCDNPHDSPVQVSWNNCVNPTITWLAAAVRSLNIPISPFGFSSGTLAGYSSWILSTISPDNAQRSSSESSYLRKVVENNA